MKYLLNLGTGALDDVETPTLGEKFALKDDKLEEAIRELDNRFGPGTVIPLSEAPQPENPYKDFTDRNPAANGGMMRQNYAAGPLILPPAMLYGAGVALGIGSQIKGENVLEQSRILKEHISENSDDPKVQALLMSLGIVTQDVKDNVSESVTETPAGLVIGGGETKEEAKPIILSTPIENYEGSFKDQGLTIPETEKQLPNTGGRIDVPISEGMDIAKTGPITFTNQKEDKEIKIPFKKIKKTYAETYAKGGSGMREKIYKKRNKNFVNNVKNILDTEYEGNLTKLAKDLNVDRSTLFGDFNRHGIDTETTGAKTIQQFNLGGKKLALKDATNLAKKDDQYLINTAKDRLGKDYSKSKNKYVNLKDLAETMGIQMYKKDGTVNPVSVDDLITRLNRTDKTFGLKRKKGLDGRTNYYKLEDTIKKFQKHNLSKPVIGDSSAQIKNRSNFIRKQDPTGSLVRDNLTTQIRNRVIKTFGKETIKYAGENIGHSESVANQIQFKKLYKGSNVGDISTLVFQDEVVNKNILQKFDLKSKGTEQLRKKYLNILEDLIGKDSNQLNKKIAEDAVNELNNLNKKARKSIIEAAKETPILKGQENRIADFKLTLPERGEKFKSGMLNIDMTNIDPATSVGKILEINPEAKTYEDLTKEQKTLYKENFKNQMADYLTYFYEEADFDTEDLLENLEELKPTKKYAAGGVIPDQEIMNYANGGRINYENGSPKPQLDGNDFLNELEFKFNNIDSVTLDDTPITYDDSKSKIAQFNDLLDYKNIPYVADLGVQTLSRIGEFGARVLPATGNLISDILQKPMFKVKSSYLRDGEGEILDYGETTKKDNVKFVGGPIFKNFLENITPTSTEKLVGLDTLINEEKKKMIARGDSSLMVKVGETVALGGELVAPIFPGLKLLRTYASAKGVKPTKEVAKTIEQEIDAMAKAEGMNRREFLVASGAVGTLGLAKLLGISSELPKVAKTAEAVTSVAKTADGVPQYLYNLRNVIRLRGKLQPSSSAFLDGQEVYTYKGITLYHNSTAVKGDGSFRIAKEFETDSIVPGEPSYNKVEMEVNKGGDVVVDEGLSTQKVVKAADEYEEATAYPAREGGEDVDFYVEDDFHKQLEEISKELDEIDQKVEMFGYDK